MPKNCVAHTTGTYLPMSQSWIYHQLVFLDRYHPVVLCKRTINQDYFVLDSVHSLYGRPWWKVVHQKLQRRRHGYYPFQLQAIEQSEAKLIHSHGGNSGRRNFRLARRLGLPHCVSFYGADIWKGALNPDCLADYREMFHSSALFLVEGAAMRDKVVSLGCPPAKVQIQRLGIRPEQIVFRNRAVEGEAPIHILMAGRAIEKKGHFHGLQAFQRVAGRNPQARLTIMTWGDKVDRVVRIDRLKDYIVKSGLENRVEIVGQLPYNQYLEYTQRCHLFLNPSVHASNGDAEGGFPVTMTEMMAGGMPVVATDHCDAREIVQHNVTGLLAAQNDPDDLADKLDRMIQDRERWPEFARNGRRLVETEYNSHLQALKLEQHYDVLLQAVARDSRRVA